MATKRSSGILLYRDREGTTEFLLVHPGGPYWARRDDGAWSIPKGGIEGEEESREAALRELDEELGSAAPDLDADELIELGSVRQRAGKVVEAWAAEGDFDPAALDSNTFEMEWPPRSGREVEFPEVDRADWFDLEGARRKLLPAQGEFLDRLLEHLGRPVARLVSFHARREHATRGAAVGRRRPRRRGGRPRDRDRQGGRNRRRGGDRRRDRKRGGRAGAGPGARRPGARRGGAERARQRRGQEGAARDARQRARRRDLAPPARRPAGPAADRADRRGAGGAAGDRLPGRRPARRHRPPDRQTRA